jgi:hypothetical protein
VHPLPLSNDDPAPVADGLASRVLVWATDWRLGQALTEALARAEHAVCQLDGDAELVSAHQRGGLLVAECGPRLQAQLAFLRMPFILVDPPGLATRALAERAYAVVASAAEAGLAVDRFFEHRQLAEHVAGRRGPPRRCARCGRGFDARKANGAGTARRFVRFGAIALCGGCVEYLRVLLRRAQVAVVDADR